MIVFRIGYARRQEDPCRFVERCREALEALPTENAFGRGLVTFWLAQALERLDDWEGAVRTFAQARQIGQASDGRLIALVTSGEQARMAWSDGDLHAVAEICREMMATLIQPAQEAGQQTPYACYAYVALGRTLVEWNELEEAEPLLVRGIELAEQAGERAVQSDGCRDLALLHWIQGRFAEAFAWMDRAVQAWPSDPSHLEALRARIWLAQGETDRRRLEQAIRWAEGRPLVPSGEYDWELQTTIRVRIAQYRARGKPDLAPVEALLAGRLANPPLLSSGWLVQNLALHALLLDALGRREEAYSPLARGLQVSRETGRVLIWLEHGPPMYALLRAAVRGQRLDAQEAAWARQLLAAFEARGRAGVQAPPTAGPALHAAGGPGEAVLLDPLSEREREVLRLLATTLSGPEIADALTISLSTFRSHTKRIYSKLDVHSRLDAVVRAQALGLLPGGEKEEGR
jgi:LuxR family maltose regulon positive regulatory protein